jgi:hypothetical protein
MVCASAVILALDNPAFLVANENPFRGLPGFVSSGNPLSLPTAYPFLPRFLHLTKATKATSETAASILERLDDFISFAQQQKEGSDEFSKVAVWKGSSNIGNRGSAALAEKATEDKSVVTLTCCDDVVGSGVPRKKASGGESEVASMGMSKIFTADAAAIATHVTARITASNPAIAAATKFSVNNIDKDVDAADCLFDMEEDDNYHPLNTAVSTAMTRTMEEIEIIPSVDNRLAPQDSGLQHFTSKLKKDIGYYFTLKPTDPVLCNEYVTDIFKSLYAAEVSTNELSKIIVPIDRSHASSSFVVD